MISPSIRETRQRARVEVARLVARLTDTHGQWAARLAATPYDLAVLRALGVWHRRAVREAERAERAAR